MVATSDDLLEETRHVLSAKWWLQRAHLVDDAPERPDICLLVVGEVLPDLRGGVVRGACLRVEHALARDLGDVEITELAGAVLVQKHVRTLQI